jgi:hypothetical protein
MAFPVTTINTSNLDSDADSPAAARGDLFNAVTALNNMIESANGVGGVPILNGSGKLASSTIPNTLESTGTLTLAPTNNIVQLPLLVRLETVTVAQAAAFTTQSRGDVIAVEDGDAGNLCLAVYDGADWLRIALGAAISAT